MWETIGWGKQLEFLAPKLYEKVTILQLDTPSLGFCFEKEQIKAVLELEKEYLNNAKKSYLIVTTTCCEKLNCARKFQFPTSCRRLIWKERNINHVLSHAFTLTMNGCLPLINKIPAAWQEHPF